MASARGNADERFRRRRLQSRVRRARPFLIALGAAVVVCGLAWLVLISSVLGVHDVKVDGPQTIDDDRVREQADIATGAPLATLDSGGVAGRLEELPRVADATVRRNWPRGVTLEVRERTAIAVVDIDGALRGIDDEGVDFRRYASRPDGVPKIELDSDLGADRDTALAEAARVIGTLDDSIGKRVRGVEVAGVDSIDLLLTGGDRVRWGSADDSERKHQVLKALLDVPAAVYDVTAPEHPSTSDS